VSGPIAVKLAVMFLLPSIVMVVGFSLPDKSPDHPVNSYPDAGVAFNVTCASSSYSARSGDFVTEPFTAVTSKVYVGRAIGAKFAVTDLSPSMITVAGFILPDKPPDHPVNSYPDAGVAFNVTSAFSSYSARSGDLVTEPFTAVMRCRINLPPSGQIDIRPQA